LTSKQATSALAAQIGTAPRSSKVRATTIGRIEAYRRLLSLETCPDPDTISERDRRLLRMLVGSLADKAVTETTSPGGSSIRGKR
jgi:hypothetical protein